MTRKVPVLVVFFGVFLMVFALGAAYFQHPDSITLPPELASFYIQHRLEGVLATDAFNALHERFLPLSAGSVGYYGKESEVTLWIVEVPFSWMASWMVSRISAEIATYETAFHPIGEQSHLDHRIYEVTGEEQSHFYYQAGKLIVWLSAEPRAAEEALDRVLEIYH